MVDGQAKKGTGMKAKTNVVALRSVVDVKAINDFAADLVGMTDKQLEAQFVASVDDELKYNMARWNAGVRIGLVCADAARRFGKSGRYQQFLDMRGLSQSNADRWRDIATALRTGKLPPTPPRELGEDRETWTQSAALAYLKQPKLTDAAEQAKDVTPARKSKADDVDDTEILREIDRAMSALRKLAERAAKNPELAAKQSLRILKAARKINTEANERIEDTDGEETPEE